MGNGGNPDRGDGGPRADAAPDSGTASDSSTADRANTLDSGVIIINPGVSNGLKLQLPASPPVGLPFPIIVRTADGKLTSATVALTVGAISKSFLMRRGRGATMLTLTTAGTVTVKAIAEGLSAERVVTALDRTKKSLAGVLSGDALQWDRTMDVVVTGTVSVPAGSKLTVGPGTRVLLDAKANLDISGTLEVVGTELDPVLFTRSGAGQWGGISINAGKSELRHALLIQGGGDGSRRFGHDVALDDGKTALPTQPVLLADGGDVLFEGGAVTDCRGCKGPSATANGTVTVRDALITRVSQGGETNRGLAIIEGSHIVEIPDGDPDVTSDDADGYHFGPPKAGGGANSVKDTVFSHIEDDCIDQNAADVVVDRVWMEAIYHEAIAASDSKTVTISNSVITWCGQGLEAGWGTGGHVINAKNVLIAGCGVGVRFGDDYDTYPPETGSIKASYIAVLKEPLAKMPPFVGKFNDRDGKFWQKQLTVWNWDFNLNRPTGGPRAGAIEIACSLVQHPDYDGMSKNGTGPLLIDAKGCPEKKMLAGCPDASVGPTSCWWVK